MLTLPVIGERRREFGVGRLGLVDSGDEGGTVAGAKTKRTFPGEDAFALAAERVWSNPGHCDAASASSILR